jgi:tape measure domain-containing protein
MFGNDSSLNIIVRLQDQASKQLDALSAKFGGFQKKLDPAIGASTKLAIGMGAAGTAMGAFGFQAVKAAASMEQSMIAFETMLGSADRAKSFYADLAAFAKKTPFTLTGLETASKQLLAYGFAQEEVLPNLKNLGDIAAGVGMDKLPNLILAFGQVKAATRLTGMELRQFTEAGVPLLDQLAQQMGKPVSAIQEMVSAGQIGFPEVEKALAALTGEGGRFNDLMDKQSKSLGGMWSNLQDAWEQFMRGEGQKLIEWAKIFVAILIDLVQNKLPPLINAIASVVDWFGKHKEVLIIVAGAITGALVPALIALATTFFTVVIPAFAAAAVALAPFIIGGAIVGGIVAGGLYIYKNWEMIQQKLVAVWAAIKGAFAGGVNYLIGLAEGWANAWVKAVNTIIGALNKIKVSIPGWVPGIGGKSFGINLPLAPEVKLPRLEHGGVVPGARGTPVPIIAHGQERIIPAGRGGMGATTVTVNINNPTVRNDGDLATMKRMIDDAMRGLMRDHKLATI